MTTTETETLASLSLALAGAKKPCPCIGVDGNDSKHYWCQACAMNHYCYAVYDTTAEDYYHTDNCEDCKGTDEVYVLSSEVRVECTFGDGSYYGQQGA